MSSVLAAFRGTAEHALTVGARTDNPHLCRYLSQELGSSLRHNAIFVAQLLLTHTFIAPDTVTRLRSSGARLAVEHALPAGAAAGPLCSLAHVAAVLSSRKAVPSGFMFNAVLQLLGYLAKLVAPPSLVPAVAGFEVDLWRWLVFPARPARWSTETRWSDGLVDKNASSFGFVPPLQRRTSCEVLVRFLNAAAASAHRRGSR